jgi:hypothetical protein
MLAEENHESTNKRGNPSKSPAISGNVSTGPALTPNESLHRKCHPDLCLLILDGRHAIVSGKIIEPESAVQLACQLHPADAWQLDAKLWRIGKDYCHAKNPACADRDLVTHWVYAAGVG